MKCHNCDRTGHYKKGCFREGGGAYGPNYKPPIGKGKGRGKVGAIEEASPAAEVKKDKKGNVIGAILEDSSDDDGNDWIMAFDSDYLARSQDEAPLESELWPKSDYEAQACCGVNRHASLGNTCQQPGPESDLEAVQLLLGQQPGLEVHPDLGQLQGDPSVQEPPCSVPGVVGAAAAAAADVPERCSAQQEKISL